MIVLAESLAEAEDATEAVDIDWEPIPAVTDIEKAIAPGAPLQFPEIGTNLIMGLRDTAGPDPLDGADVPIMGVNLGKLGFLTSCRGKDFAKMLPRLAKGQYQMDSRMTLEANPTGTATSSPRMRALNDVVLHKGGFARVLRLRVAVNREEIGTLAADGIVISTPTGSTAYSLSAGGPIVAPTVDSILITPVSPHTLAVRPILLPPDAVITVQPEDAPQEVLVTVDGQVGTSLGTGQGLSIRSSADRVTIVRFTGTTYIGRLRRKLGWGGLAERDE